MITNMMVNEKFDATSSGGKRVRFILYHVPEYLDSLFNVDTVLLLSYCYLRPANSKTEQYVLVGESVGFCWLFDL